MKYYRKGNKMAERDIKLIESYTKLNKEFQSASHINIKSYEVAEKSNIDVGSLPPKELKAWEDADRLWYVRIRDNDANKLSEKATYKGIESVIKALNKAVPERNYRDIHEIKIIQQNITYPMYGNKRVTPYGKLRVVLGIETKWVDIKLDETKGYFQYSDYFTFNRKRYYVKNIGGYMSANFVIDEEKTIAYRER